MLARWVYIAWVSNKMILERCVGSPGRRQIEGPLRPSYGEAASLPCLTLSCLALPFLVLSHPCFIIAPLPCFRILHGDREGKTRATLPPRYEILVSRIMSRTLGTRVNAWERMFLRTREILTSECRSMILDYKRKRREKTRTYTF